jgi:hypothetical protein
VDEVCPMSDEVPAVLADLDALIALHQRADEWSSDCCTTCGIASEYPTDWPCETLEIANRIRDVLCNVVQS